MSKIVSPHTSYKAAGFTVAREPRPHTNQKTAVSSFDVLLVEARFDLTPGAGLDGRSRRQARFNRR